MNTLKKEVTEHWEVETKQVGLRLEQALISITEDTQETEVSFFTPFLSLK